MKTKVGHALATYLNAWLLLCAAAPCAMVCLITGMDLPVDPVTVFQVGMLFCALSALIWLLPKYRFLPVLLCLVPFGGVVALNVKNALSGHYSAPVNGGAVVGSRIIMSYREVFPMLKDSYPITELTDKQAATCATLFCLIVLALLTMFLGWAMIRHRSLLLTVMVTAPLLAIPMGITKLPDTLPLLGLLACWLVLLLTRLEEKGERWAFTKLSLLMLPLSLAFLAGLCALVPKAHTETRPEQLTEFRSSLVGKAGDFAQDVAEKTGLLFSIGTIADQSTEMKFSQIGSLRQTDDVLFSVSTTATQPLYLRRLSMGNYDGAGWSQFSDAIGAGMADDAENSTIWDVGSDPYIISTNTLARLISGSTDTQRYLQQYESVTIYGSDSSFLYTTYQTVPQLTGVMEKKTGLSIPSISAKGDSYYSFANKDSTDASAQQYTVYFSPQAENDFGVENDSGDEFLYQSHLSEYTDVSGCSQEELDALHNLLAGVDFTDVEASAVPRLEAAKRIVKALQAVTVYDLHVSTASHDFALNFLKTGRGYCVHYATTAALLFRAYGIPARYVTGFLVDPGDADSQNGMISVLGKNAHAWVEIYIDGYGWYPIEATPAGGLASTTLKHDTSTAQTTQSATQTTQTETKTHTATQTQTTAKSSATTAQKQAASTAGESKQTNGMQFLLLIPASLLLVIGILILRRHLANHSREKRFHSEDPNRNVIELWMYLQTLSRVYPVELPPQWESLAKKAMFSQHRLTGEETEVLRQGVQSAVDEIRTGSSLWGKLKLRYLHALD
jgi:transglutaminase-like putative cysteine protease